jgi:D-psicose/D-tagatose/L-ribulose 3-epimerase
MARQLGCCTWIFGNAELAETAERCARAGLDGVELFGNVDGVDPVKAGELLKSNGLSVFSITPGDADISHPNAQVRSAALDYYDRLMDWAAELGKPLVSCHGLVTRIKPIASQQEEDRLLIEAVRHICSAAQRKGLSVVFELLNRYETHQVRTVHEGLALLRNVGKNNLKLLPDAYHMNIEEAEPAEALRQGGTDIGLYHAADSNRCGIGEGNIDFPAQIRALDDIGYHGPIILETNAPGPNPFTPEKGDGFRDVVEAQLAASVAAMRALGA